MERVGGDTLEGITSNDLTMSQDIMYFRRCMVKLKSGASLANHANYVHVNGVCVWVSTFVSVCVSARVCLCLSIVHVLAR